jgi:antitoxin component YwqK of YwqJK toxin-antitoxin module
MKEFYPNGSLTAFGPCQKLYNLQDIWVGEFEKTGLWKHYNTEGNVIHEITFNNGIIDGYCKYYNEDRTVYAEGKQIDDECVGLWRFYEDPVSIDDSEYLFTEYFGFP